MLENTKQKLEQKKLTLGQIIIIAVGAILFAATETQLFATLPDIVKFVIYLGIMILCASLGVSFVDLKELGDKFKEILLNENTSTEEKLNQFTNLAVMVLSKLGDVWELFNKEQFKNASDE